MDKNYLYLAQSTSPIDKKYNIYKMGCSTSPESRVKYLGGSCSTNTYTTLLVIPLPMGLKDVHILSHDKLSSYVLYRNEKLQRRYMNIFGQDHENGLHRRREILMFGTSFSKKRVIEMIKKLVKTMSRRGHDGNILYRCSVKGCISSGGTEYCGVCKKFMCSILNSLTYQKIQMHRLSIGKRMSKRKRILELECIESDFTNNIQKKRRRYSVKPQWEGPDIGDFWVRYNTHGGYMFEVIRIMTSDGLSRSSRVQRWSPISNRSDNVFDSIFEQETRDGTRYDTLDIVKWDDGGWIMSIKMVKSSRKGHLTIRRSHQKDFECFIGRLHGVR